MVLFAHVTESELPICLMFFAAGVLVGIGATLAFRFAARMTRSSGALKGARRKCSHD